MSLETTGVLYQGTDETGPGSVIGLGKGDRYNHANAGLMQAVGNYGKVHSGVLYGSNDHDVSITLFWEDHFSGPFVQMTVARQQHEIDFWATGDVHSWMLTTSNPRGDHETRLSYRDLFYSQWISTVDDQLGSDGSRRGDPILTWDMFPDDPSNLPRLNSSLCYLKVHQDLTIHTPWYVPDYDAWLEYWIYLYPAGGNIRATIPLGRYWVEGGLVHDQVMSKVGDAANKGQDVLLSTINEKLAGFDGVTRGRVTDIYYEPGRQSGPPASDVHGHTFDDVTIVVVA